ncbi:hypothetical protein FA15DRAFT_703256 [Coprinopsis marcescibilis]|uniref:Uncharacterized protein n=1 Tax=Coprinopsis marcescibilis TaxID=230819 RepID=A0A5C3L0J5_COPMA|nr:hypothetical protein FA15DRAFT_703256 [Coprinopsis marcescibilis]
MSSLTAEPNTCRYPISPKKAQRNRVVVPAAENSPPIGSTGTGHHQHILKQRCLNRVRPYPERDTQVQSCRRRTPPSPRPNQLEEERLVAAVEARREEYRRWKRKHDKKTQKALKRLDGLVLSFSARVGEFRGACNELRVFISTEYSEYSDNEDDNIGDDDGTITDLLPSASGVSDVGVVTTLAALARNSQLVAIDAEGTAHAAENVVGVDKASEPSSVTVANDSGTEGEGHLILDDASFNSHPGEESCHWVDQMDDQQFEEGYGAIYRREEVKGGGFSQWPGYGYDLN